MNNSVQDERVIGALALVEVTAYLRATGWHERDLIGENASIWARSDDDGVEVLLPRRSDVRDYVPRMVEILRTLEKVEHRSSTEILIDLQSTGADLVRLRLVGEDARGISVSVAAKAIESARDLMLAAACAAIEPRPLYHTRKPDQALEYLRRVRMGQTERGSFVLTFHSPVGPAIGQQYQGSLLPELEEEPYERAVTLTLSRSLGALRSAIQESLAHDDPSPIQRAVSLGVSANMCEAVAGLVRAAGNVELGMTWARARPSNEPPMRENFTADTAPILEEVARRFRAREPIEEQSVTGWVIDLHRQPLETEGRVVIRALIEGKPRNVLGWFNSDAYSLALRAHEERLPLSCFGDILREGKSWQIRNPHDVSIIPVEE